MKNLETPHSRVGVKITVDYNMGQLPDNDKAIALFETHKKTIASLLFTLQEQVELGIGFCTPHVTLSSSGNINKAIHLSFFGAATPEILATILALESLDFELKDCIEVVVTIVDDNFESTAELNIMRSLMASACNSNSCALVDVSQLENLREVISFSAPSDDYTASGSWIRLFMDAADKLRDSLSVYKGIKIGLLPYTPHDEKTGVELPSFDKGDHFISVIIEMSANISGVAHLLKNTAVGDFLSAFPHSMNPNEKVPTFSVEGLCDPIIDAETHLHQYYEESTTFH